MKRLLIGVDLLNDFCHIKGALAKSIVDGRFYGVDIIPAFAGLAKAFRSSGDPIIWLGDWHAPDDEEFERFPKHAVRNTWGAQIVEELSPKLIEASPIELKINKTRYSGFFGTDLEYQLLRLSPDEVHVGGVCTGICVMDTVGGLANRDYKIIVHKDTVNDFDLAAHEAALARMEGLYGAQIV